MKLTRLEEIYRRPLKPAEEAKKKLPLEHILKQELNYYPAKPDKFDHDILEIGPGTGDFLFHLAEQYPSKKILGIEIGKKRYEKIQVRLQKRAIKNVALIHGDARIPIHKHIQDETFEKCYVLFPDPWPKNKHAHMRLLQIDFLKQLTQKLKSGGEFTLGTDVKDYATWVRDNLSEIPEMKNEFGKNKIATHLDDVIPTFFKKKWETFGRNFWYLRYKKVGSASS